MRARVSCADFNVRSFFFRNQHSNEHRFEWPITQKVKIRVESFLNHREPPFLQHFDQQCRFQRPLILTVKARRILFGRWVAG